MCHRWHGRQGAGRPRHSQVQVIKSFGIVLPDRLRCLPWLLLLRRARVYLRRTLSQRPQKIDGTETVSRQQSQTLSESSRWNHLLVRLLPLDKDLIIPGRNLAKYIMAMLVGYRTGPQGVSLVVDALEDDCDIRQTGFALVELIVLVGISEDPTGNGSQFEDAEVVIGSLVPAEHDDLAKAVPNVEGSAQTAPCNVPIPVFGRDIAEHFVGAVKSPQPSEVIT